MHLIVSSLLNEQCLPVFIIPRLAIVEQSLFFFVQIVGFIKSASFGFV